MRVSRHPQESCKVRKQCHSRLIQVPFLASVRFRHPADTLFVPSALLMLSVILRHPNIKHPLDPVTSSLRFPILSLDVVRVMAGPVVASRFYLGHPSSFFLLTSCFHPGFLSGFWLSCDCVRLSSDSGLQAPDPCDDTGFGQSRRRAHLNITIGPLSSHPRRSRDRIRWTSSSVSSLSSLPQDHS